MPYQLNADPLTDAPGPFTRNDPGFGAQLLYDHAMRHDQWANARGDLAAYAVPTVMVRDGYGEWTFRQYDNRAARPGGVYESYPTEGPAYRSRIPSDSIRQRDGR